MNNTKKLLAFLAWMSGIGIVGYAGWKMLTSVGAGVAYDMMIKDFESGETCVMTGANGKPLFVRKVDIKSDSQ